MHIDYPVAIDNQQAIWNAFHNVYWPALYLLDAQGHIRYRQFGEGEYARTEREIQKLLLSLAVIRRTIWSWLRRSAPRFPRM